MKKIFLVIFLNLIVFLFVILLSEIIIFNFNKNYDGKIAKFHNAFEKTEWETERIKNFYSYANRPEVSFRRPDGLQYKKTPIIVFGCSFAFGQYLNSNQTFSYKLSNLVKRPVYNRGKPAGGLSQMYYQVNVDKFYKKVPYSDTVIYIMIQDHYRRMLCKTFNITDDVLRIHYLNKNNKLVLDDYEDSFNNFLQSLYTVRYLNHVYADFYVHNGLFSNKLTDEALLYFIETRAELQKRWKKPFKFIVIMYNFHFIPYHDVLRKKLEDNGFIVIETNELTNADLRSEKYLMQDNLHPKESAWDLLTPLIVEKLNL